MKAISIRAPWWFCITDGAKRIENRSANFPRKYRGPVLIQASTWWRQQEVLDTLCTLHLRGMLPFMPSPGELRSYGGHVVATAEIVGARPNGLPGTPESEKIWEAEGGIALVLANVRTVRPVPLKGRLGLFNVPDWREPEYVP